jgi:hypothetical protein
VRATAGVTHTVIKLAEVEWWPYRQRIGVSVVLAPQVGRLPYADLGPGYTSNGRRDGASRSRADHGCRSREGWTVQPIRRHSRGVRPTRILLGHNLDGRVGTLDSPSLIQNRGVLCPTNPYTTVSGLRLLDTLRQDVSRADFLTWRWSVAACATSQLPVVGCASMGKECKRAGGAIDVA